MFSFIKKIFTTQKVKSQDASLQTLKPFFEEYISKNENSSDSKSLMSGIFYGTFEVIDKLKSKNDVSFEKIDIIKSFEMHKILELASFNDPSADNLRHILQKFNLVETRFLHKNKGSENVKYGIKHNISMEEYRLFSSCIYELQQLLDKHIQSDPFKIQLN